MRYPLVTGEYETLAAVKAGASIARFGDGEWKLCRNLDCISQVKDRKLQSELQRILLVGSTKKLLVGIPPLDNLSRIPEGKKRNFWTNQLPYGERLLSPKAKYHSSFITRPDNAPWIDTTEFYDDLISLWRGKDVTLAIGSERSLCERNMQAAKSITYVRGLYRDSYQEIDRIEAEIRAAGNKTVILCMGATATALAWRLAGDFHAIDMGHCGLKSFWKKARGLV